MSRIFVMGRAVLALVALCASACSGGAKNGNGEQSAQQQPSEREVALAKLRSRQEAACPKVGKALFACAMEEAQATMPPEEFAKLELEQLEPEYMRRFLDECLAGDMSPRQVGVYETCLQDTRCTTFVTCLDSAQPQPATQSAGSGNGAP